MASRSGLRVPRTDGSNFRHLERVAPHYNHGPLLQRRFVFMLHLYLGVLMFVHVLPELCLRFGLKTRLLVEKWPFLQSNFWECVWCFGSLLPTVFGYLSLNRNRTGLMRISITGTIVFGLGSHAYELMQYYQPREPRHRLYVFTLIVLLYIFSPYAFIFTG
ncbi:unnamed protein product [Echinostoma caproni]|uniref:EXPERA domain-containing protein n=1 Tax=Echinostoma caproni TaxID=27848 RepID=A0A183B3Y1_9TREM|nr:unnamed protein product [Echinostoma caproni]